MHGGNSKCMEASELGKGERCGVGSCSLNHKSCFSHLSAKHHLSCAFQLYGMTVMIRIAFKN